MSHEPANADPSPVEGPLEEQLVAYLDGELDDRASRRIEELLATDPKVRQTLERLEGTWDLLDNLHRAHVEDAFTQSTLEMVAVAVEEDVEKRQAEAPRRLRRRWLIGVTGVLAAGVAGFLATIVFWPRPNEQLLEDLPVLERLDQYRQVNELEFLERLLEKEDELFGEEGANAS